ncbi:MAG: hypothetical protein LBQ60_14875 [Bacteroidales bacterium]|jgi:hypothetical protein|nr:hypothetical protein [Bacteroidales bacterium]
MATFIINEVDCLRIKDGAKTVRIVKKDKIDAFNQDILGLGHIGEKSKLINALSVIFDLEGFTDFCKQIDPHLAVPEYLSDFLKWIFEKIRKELISKTYEDGYSVWADLPFLSKYLGDGILFLWDTENMGDASIRNVVVSMYEVCRKYQMEFLPLISQKIVSPPTKLRCGIARGAIYSVGDGNDFVGPCINMSARLQKLNSLTFCFSRRGINPDEMGAGYKGKFIVKRVDIRGIGDEELVCLSQVEYDKLSETEKAKFRDV